MATRLEQRRVIFRAGFRSEHPVDGTNMADHQINIQTNGTTVVNIFGPKGAPFKGLMTAVVVISQDTTAGNITLKIGANTVATIAKGTASGALVGAASLSTPNFNPGDAVTVVSSSAGNVLIQVNYTVATPTDV